MTISINSFLRRGYIPLACNKYAGIAWQGEYLPDFWMWNRQYTSDIPGNRYIQTVKVPELKEAALRLYKDKWVPLKTVDNAMLRRMERALRANTGLRQEGINLPDAEFLSEPEKIPIELLSPAAKRFIGINK